MVNVLKLKAKLVEKGKNVDYLADSLKVNRTTIYRKLAAGGDDFTIGEVDKISQVLNLSVADINNIFLASLLHHKRLTKLTASPCTFENCIEEKSRERKHESIQGIQPGHDMSGF